MIGLALTPEQFKTLLRMVYIGNTVANGHRDADDFLKEYDDLEQYVFSRAKEAGFPGATWHHESGNEDHHHPSRAFEDDPEVNAIMDTYDLEAANGVLAEKLAERDIETKHGPHAKDRMAAKDYEELLLEYADEYERYFLANGFVTITVPTVEE